MKLCNSRKNILCAWADLEYSLTTSFPAPTHHRLRQCFFLFWQKLKHAARDFVIWNHGSNNDLLILSFFGEARASNTTQLESSNPPQPSLKVPCCVEKEQVWNWDEQVSVRNRLKVSSDILGTHETVCTSLISKLCSWNAEEMIIVFIAAGGLLTSLRFKTHAYFIASSDVFDTNWQVREDPRSTTRVTSQDWNPTVTNVLGHSENSDYDLQKKRVLTTSQTKYYI